MNGYNLTDFEKVLLRTLVDHDRKGDLHKPIICLGDSQGYQIFLEGKTNLMFKDDDATGALDALREAGMVGARWNSQGTNLVYTIRQAGYDAVDNNFELPPPQLETQLNIGAIIQTMSGGNVQAVGLADQADISQVVNDPVLLQSQVEALTEELLNVVKDALTGDDLIDYAQAVRSFKDELLAEETDPSLLKRFAGTLSFLGDIEGTIGLIVRVWPYLYPLLLISAQKLGLV